MEPEFDISKYAAEVTTDIIKSAYTNISSGLQTRLKKQWQKLFADFEPYLKESWARNSRVKLLTSENKPVPIECVYVSPTFSCHDEFVTANDLISEIRDGKRCIISGNGGRGKHFFYAIYGSQYSMSRRVNYLYCLN